MERRGPFHNFAGARLPIADGPKPSPVPCDRNPEHLGGIRFALRRYDREVGEIRLCGPCFTELNPPRPADPLHFEDVA